MTAFLAIYDQRRFGDDIRLYAHRSSANAWRTRIADRNWNTAMIDEEKPERQLLANVYFEHMSEREEYFTIVPVTLDARTVKRLAQSVR